MLPILRRRPSVMLVALLCALVLSRTPAPMFAEDAFSSLVKIEESTPIAVVAALEIGVALSDPATTLVIQSAGHFGAPAHAIIEHPVLRL